MPLSLEKIEEFFVARFTPVSPGPGRELHHFDGYAHWSVYFDDTHCLFITADRDPGPRAFPAVELAVYCLAISTLHASGVGLVLILHPNDTEETRHCVALTKTEAGRISMSTSIGADTSARRAEPGAPANEGHPIRSETHQTSSATGFHL